MGDHRGAASGFLLSRLMQIKSQIDDLKHQLDDLTAQLQDTKEAIHTLGEAIEAIHTTAVETSMAATSSESGASFVRRLAGLTLQHTDWASR